MMVKKIGVLFNFQNKNYNILICVFGKRKKNKFNI